MKAYTVNAFYVCQITGRALVEVQFQMLEEPRACLHPFSSAEAATQYIEREARDWLLGCLEAYVQHKKHIIEVSTSEEKRKELQVCLQALEKYQGYATETVCQKFLAGFKYFEAILPNPNNKSYQSSAQNLHEIKTFCEQKVKAATKTKAA